MKKEDIIKNIRKRPAPKVGEIWYYRGRKILIVNQNKQQAQVLYYDPININKEELFLSTNEGIKICNLNLKVVKNTNKKN